MLEASLVVEAARGMSARAASEKETNENGRKGSWGLGTTGMVLELGNVKRRGG